MRLVKYDNCYKQRGAVKIQALGFFRVKLSSFDALGMCLLINTAIVYNFIIIFYILSHARRRRDIKDVSSALLHLHKFKCVFFIALSKY